MIYNDLFFILTYKWFGPIIKVKYKMITYTSLGLHRMLHEKEEKKINDEFFFGMDPA